MSTQSKAILALGKKLVEEFELDQSVDTLGRWMAHHIAELIHDAENAELEDQPSKQERCASAILELWRHRAELPNGKRPFEDVEPILRALESLDPGDETPRYFRRPRMVAADAEPDTEVEKWLDIADGVDFTARQLIRYCLVCASQAAQDKTAEWVALAEAAGLDDDVDVRALRIMMAEAELSGDETTGDVERKELEDRLSRLEAFQEMAEGLAADLRSKLTS
ncbi:AVAST type 3 anti-phage proein Avs3b [Aquisalimonas sp. 2447]|uniref:AVAST type 3 anti-phage proein Avs3b n=1 Tax=Aquisalimonas sp. 2447 TaxID=2740807 RepID=UPI001C2C94B0|nr:AVAST type 3 anti-phage proein Avs3b [Aquisalimonas sp. 2447]